MNDEGSIESRPVHEGADLEESAGLGRSFSRRRAMGLMAGAGLALTLGPEDARAEPAWVKRPIPSTGEELPVVGLGTWQAFDVGDSAAEIEPRREVLARFAERGAKVIDSSPMYGRAEQVVGRLVAELGIRDRLFLATKVWTSGRGAGVDEMNRSLELLGVETLDLMQIHNLVDAETHLDTLAEWKAAGRIRYVGITHYVSSAYPEIEELAKSRQLDFVQLNYSLAEREAEERILDVLADRGVAVIVNRPFAGGQLFRQVRGHELPDWASEIGCATWGQFFLKYVLGATAVTCVIPGTSKVEHLDDNLDAGAGPTPDEAWRRRMTEYFDQL
jgi:aryl-alcohol dehydrogenase-like predicted oxidoreductase